MRIAFCGAQGTGKSTLVDSLIKLEEFKDYKRYTNVQRILHNYLGNKFPHSSNTNNISQSGIYSNFILQLLQEENLICDRSLLDAFMYSELSENVDHIELEEVFNKAIELYDVIFYTPIEFTVEDDGFRDSGTDYVKLCDSTLQKYIEKYGSRVKIVRVSGSIQERLNIIKNNL